METFLKDFEMKACILWKTSFFFLFLLPSAGVFVYRKYPKWKLKLQLVRVLL